jgi:hypothetical protein
VEYWKPKVAVEELETMLNLDGSPTVLDQVARLHNCAIYPDQGRLRIMIGVSDRATLNSVVARLTRVEDTFKRGFKPIATFHVEVDGKTNFRLKIIPFGRQKAKEQTTLFMRGNSKWIEHDRDTMYSVRLLEYDLKENTHKPCTLDSSPVHNAKRSTSHCDWDGYVFKGRVPLLAPEHFVLDVQETREIDPGDMICAFHSVEQSIAPASHVLASEASGQPINITDYRDTNASSLVKRHPRVKAPKDEHTQESQSPYSSTPVSQDYVMLQRPTSLITPEESDGSSTTTVVAGRPRDQAPAFVKAEPALGFNLGFRPASTASENTTTEGFSRRPRERRAAEADGSSSQEIHDPQKHQAKESTAVGVGTTVEDKREEIEATGLGRRPRERKPAPGTSSQTTDRTSVGHNEQIASTGIHIGTRPSSSESRLPFTSAGTPRTVRKPRERTEATLDPILYSVPTESVQTVSEVSSRRIVRTANQKQPSSSLGANGAGEPESLRLYNSQSINAALFGAFENARYWPGDLKFEVKLGRLILADVPREIIRKKALRWQEWEDFITNPRADFEHYFTKILTRQHHDVEFIRDLRLGKGEKLFSETPVSRRVTYDIEILKKNKRLNLSVDGETFKPTLYEAKKDFGFANVINPVHSWDYRFELSGKKSVDLDTNPFIQGIVDSLTCTEGTDIPELTFTVDGPALTLSRVFLKRQTKYPVISARLQKGVPMELVTTETYDLFLAEHPETSKLYKAFALSKQEMKNALRLYWTVSLVPTTVNAILEENQDLGVGECVDWTTNDVLKTRADGTGCVLSMMDILTGVVGKIDGVGAG